MTFIVLWLSSSACTAWILILLCQYYCKHHSQLLNTTEFVLIQYFCLVDDMHDEDIVESWAFSNAESDDFSFWTKATLPLLIENNGYYQMYGIVKDTKILRGSSMNSKPTGYPRFRLFTPTRRGFFSWVVRWRKNNQRIRLHWPKPIDFAVGCIISNPLGRKKTSGSDPLAFLHPSGKTQRIHRTHPE